MLFNELLQWTSLDQFHPGHDFCQHGKAVESRQMLLGIPKPWSEIEAINL